MVRLILTLIGFFGKIIARILNKRAKLKPAADILEDTSPTEDAVSEAKAKARAKFEADKKPDTDA